MGADCVCVNEHNRESVFSVLTVIIHFFLFSTFLEGIRSMSS